MYLDKTIKSNGGNQMTLFQVRESYIAERIKIWNKLQNTASPSESNQLAKQYDKICEDYKEFLLANDLNDIE